jgi:hypothetical protein
MKFMAVFVSVSFVFFVLYSDAGENMEQDNIKNVHGNYNRATPSNPNLRLPDEAPENFYNPRSNEKWRISNISRLNHRFWKFEIMDIVDFYLDDVDFIIDHPKKVLMISDNFNGKRDKASRIVGLMQTEPKKISKNNVIERVSFCAYDTSYLGGTTENSPQWLILFTKSTSECIHFIKENYDITHEIYSGEYAEYKRDVKERLAKEKEDAKMEMIKFNMLLEKIKRIKSYNETRRKAKEVAKSYLKKLVEAKRRSDEKYGNNQSDD